MDPNITYQEMYRAMNDARDVGATHPSDIIEDVLLRRHYPIPTPEPYVDFTHYHGIARCHALSLVEWFKNGGYTPYQYSKSTMESYISSVLYHTEYLTMSDDYDY